MNEPQDALELPPPLSLAEAERIIARLEDVFDAVLDDERLPEKFRTIRLAQMQDRIRTLRQRR